jgi:hypothetical protein
VAQGEGPEFKSQYCQTNKQKNPFQQTSWVLHTLVIPAVWEAELGESWSKGSPGKSSRPYLKNN